MDSLLRFESTIRSEITKNNYKRSLDLFKKYIGAKDYDSILSIPKERLQDSIEEYVIHLKNTKNPNSVKALFYGVKHFFIMNRVSLDWDIISKMFPETTQIDPPSLQLDAGPSDTSSKKIPDWAKNIFLWYGQDKVSEDELLNAIKYLINEKILIIN